MRKREDGYHDLETIFYPVVGLHDELEVEAADHFNFVQEGLAVDCPAEDNLIIKCYRRMRAKYPTIGDVQIRFKKNIPFGAGLGGGSSDAAHMAIALNAIFALGLSQQQLAEEVRLAKYPSMSRDIAVVVPLEVTNAELEAVIREHAGELLIGVKVFDIYTGKQVAEGCKSMAFNLTYQAADRTLTDAEVDASMKTVIAKVAEEYKAELRA